MSDPNENGRQDEEPKAGHPGPVDKGGEGGMATREQAAEDDGGDD